MRHYTLGKDQAKAASSHSVMQALTDVLQKDLLRQQEHLWHKEPPSHKEPG